MAEQSARYCVSWPSAVTTVLQRAEPFSPRCLPSPQELHMVADKVRPVLPELVQALEGYHLHSPDGWVTTAGCVTRAGG